MQVSQSEINQIQIIVGLASDDKGGHRFFLSNVRGTVIPAVIFSVLEEIIKRSIEIEMPYN